MAAITEKSLRSDLKKGTIPSVILILSEDPAYFDYFQELAIRSFLSKEGSRDGIVTVFGDELNAQNLRDDLSSQGLFSTRKLYFLKSMERLKAKEWESLLPLLAMPLENNHVFLFAQKLHGKLKFLEAISKSNNGPCVLKIEDPKPEQWDFWIQEFSKATGVAIAEDAKEFLKISTLGNLSDLKQAIEYAAIYNPAVTNLHKEHFEVMGARSLFENVFDLSSMLMAGNKAKSMHLMQELIANGEEPLAIIGLLNRQYRWLLGIAAGFAEGASDKDISIANKLWPQANRVLFPAARRLGGKGAMRGLKFLQEAEFSLKDSKVPAIHIMSDLVVELLASFK